MKGFITYTIRQGDTLQRIASLYSLAAWQEIAALNNLTYPFIDDDVEAAEWKDRNPNIRYVADRILVPANYDALPEIIDLRALQKLAYGCDLDITTPLANEYGVVNIESHGELRDDGCGDLSILEGIENLKQALIIRLITPRGTLPLHPAFGSEILRLVGKRRTYQQLIKIKLEIQRVIKDDFRVTRIENHTVTTRANGGVVSECDIIPIEPFSSFQFQYEIPLMN